MASLGLNATASGTPPPTGCALVTGASRGIGAETARLLAADGWTVGVNYREDLSGAEAVVASIVESGARAFPVRGDISDPHAVENLFAVLEQRAGPVLVLVNNAATRADMFSVHLDDDAWTKVLETNLSGVFRTTRRALTPMIRARWGRIINLGSVAGLRGNAGQANYVAAKAGVIALTRTVAAEVARRGITVNAVVPGYVPTALNADMGPELLPLIPVGRAGTAYEVAACIRFLASPAASYVTGSTVVVDGGMSA